MRAVAALFARSPNVIGYEAMNEPWPGADWSSCLTGCADLEASRLAPFYARMTAAVRSVDRRHPVLVEPFVLFNFGNADTSLPGPGSPNVLSTHVYALDAKGNASAMDRSVRPSNAKPLKRARPIGSRLRARAGAMRWPTCMPVRSG